MRSLAEIGAFLEHGRPASAPPVDCAREYLAAGEEVLENWLVAHGQAADRRQSEGFRLLALHRQAAKGDPSFNACRETCRELVYHYNVILARAGRPRPPPPACDNDALCAQPSLPVHQRQDGGRGAGRILLFVATR